MPASYDALIYDMSIGEERKELARLKEEERIFEIIDTLEIQLQDFIACQRPASKLSPSELESAVKAHLDGRSLDEYGCWVFYPWSGRLVHLLPEDEFKQLRTDRNQYKITEEEQRSLSDKKIGLIGLSVGHAVANSLAMERSFGELRIADFDVLDLSNLNRIRSSVHHIGIPKTELLAREIAELDPYLKVTCYDEGVTEENIDEFIDGLDLIIDECDSIDIKIITREKARAKGIPVIMETSDRGMLDIERYDLDRELPILHGLVEGLRSEDLKGLTNEEKIPYVLPILGLEESSLGLRTSMFEIERSISTWPQLGSDVMVGGGTVANVARRILLGRAVKNGRYYIDMDDMIAEESSPESSGEKASINSKQDIDHERILEQVRSYIAEHPSRSDYTDKFFENLILKARKAPSGGNTQPWLWHYQGDTLFLFLDTRLPETLYNFMHMGSWIAFGAAAENIELTARNAHMKTSMTQHHFDADASFPLAVSFSFSKMTDETRQEDELFEYIDQRITNRLNQNLRPLPEKIDTAIQERVHATFSGITDVRFITEPEKKALIKETLSISDKLMMMNPKGHQDLYGELAWEKDFSETEGINVHSLGLTPLEMAGMRIAKDESVMSFIRKIDGGDRFSEMNHKSVDASAAFGLFTVKEFDAATYFKLGKAIQDAWLYTTSQEVAFHPMSGILFLIQRAEQEGKRFFSDAEISQIEKCKSLIKEAFDLDEGTIPAFMFRIYVTADRPVPSNRRPLDQITIKHDHTR
ncbi:MAG: Rv1355c family protein [Flavobacteriales bacterium]|nr:Rv1355c family protein [Flavobacteriales bacterium]